MGAFSYDFTVIEHENLVSMNNRADTLCEFFDRPERLLDYLENCSGVLYSISDYKDIKR